MLRKLRFNYVRLLTSIFLFSVSLLSSTNSEAQTRLIHYWNFNTLTNNDTLAATSGGCGVVPLNNRIRPINADYTIMTGATPQFVFRPQPGVTSGWPSVAVETVCFTYLDFTTGSLVNSFLGSPAGLCARPRNPTDSTEIRLYAPTTNYQNIVVSLATENSSTTSGPRWILFDYSVDSGTTWTKAGLSKLKDSVWSSSYNTTTIAVADQAAYNNPKFVFRIKDSINTALGSGNVRYDNIAVQGDTVVPAGTLIYFWHFNTFSGTFHNPTFPYLAPDYFIHDSSKVKIHFGLFPGTSLSNPTYFDNVALATGANDWDTVNQNWPGVPALPLSVVSPTTGSTGIRMRNPNDSTYMYIYMPTLNYKNIVLKWATQTSSLGNGDSIQTYNYSLDSGATWQLSGISEALDSAWQVGMPVDPAAIGFRPVPITIKFTDPAANNNPKLVFRIHLAGRNHGSSGNNRFDNFSIQGDSIITPAATITTTPSAYGSPYCNTAPNAVSVPFTTSGGALGQVYAVQITNVLGVFPANTDSNIIGTGLTSPISAVIPAGTPAGSLYRLRVVSKYPGIYGSDNGTNIVLNGIAGPIAGPTTVCAAGGLDTLVETGAGTWSVSNANATIGSSTGIVVGATPGVDTVTYTIGVGCVAKVTITVNPVPATITGTFTACVGLGTSLSDATSLGTWSSSNTSVATIGSSSGAVSGLTVGTTTVSYTLPTGCRITQPVTVNPLPSAITGTMVACAGSGSTLTDAGGGTWSSSNTSLATIGSSTGTVAALAAGVPTITYTLPTGCIATASYTVNPNPAPISGSNACLGTGTPFTDGTAFGAWSSSTPAVASVGSASGIVTGISLGTATISYILSTGCYITQPVTVNPVPAAITGTSVMCAGLTTTLNCTTSGGVWSSSNTALATVNPSTGVVTGVAAGNPVITYTLPTGCIATQVVTVNTTPPAPTGPTSVYCIPNTVTLTDAVTGGVWTSSNPGIATVGSSSGVVTSVAAGSATITYTLPTGCQSTLGESVTSSPAAIVGTSIQCVGSSSNLTDLTAFGAWSSSNSAVASVGSGTGIMTGVSAGSVTITYQLSPSCVTTRNFTVNPVPQAISGIAAACPGTTSALSDTGAGIWTSSVPALATVGASTGIVTGVAAGNPVITYTAASGCITTTVFTVNPLPGPIAGTGSVYCIGSTSTLVDGTPGGTWSSSNTSIATIGSSSGIVTGVAAGSSTITYTLPTGCISTLVENISSTPAPISGATGTCIASNVTYSDLTAFGAWSSSNTAIATIGSGTGIMTGVSSGPVTITYSLSPLCLITKSVTVNPNPSAISGTPQVCPGTTTTLTDAGSGTWVSSIPALATIGSSSGVVNGIIAGTVMITYTLPTGCFTTQPVTINPLPSIVGPTNICMGIPTTLASTIGGGTWVSSTPSVAAIGSSSGSITGMLIGSTTITYTAPTGCTATSTVSVSPPPTPISGTTNVCTGLTSTLTDAGGGGWYSSNPAIATIGFGTGTVTGITAGTVTITYSLGTTCIVTTPFTVNPLPSAITGTMVLCPLASSTLSDASGGGAWTSSNTTVATIGSSSGMLTGVSGGTSNITYTLPTGCIATAVATINPVAPVMGTMNVCVGSTTTLTDALSGGAWTSSNTLVATVGSGSGIVTGFAAGTPVITYTLPTGCTMTSVITVNPLPAAITGTLNVCQGGMVTLSDATSGGAWSTDDPSTATIGSTSGLVTGVSNGGCTISYTLPTGCFVSTAFVVNPLPSAITGAAHSCVGLTDTLSDIPAGGTWTSGTTLIATVGSSNGVVTGVFNGTSTITYTLPTGCIATTVYTVNALPSVDTLTGGGGYCAGGTGLHVGLSASDTGIAYQLYFDTSAVGSAMSGTGSALDYGVFTAAGVYTVTATNRTTSCRDNMFGNATIHINPLPGVKGVTGGGRYCPNVVGDTGLHVGLNGSDTGVRYQLYRAGTSTVGTAISGTGSALDFGLQTVSGTYTVKGTNATTSCADTMAGSAAVIADSLFTPVVSVVAHPTGIKHGQVDTLVATVANGGPGVTYQWLLNATYIAGATTTIYVYTNTGFANKDSVTCLATSHSNCGSVISFGYKIINITDVNVNQVIANNMDVKLIPNPNNGIFTIKGTIGTISDEEVTLTISDMLGQQIYKNSVIAQGGNINEQIQLNGALANGMYLLDVRSGTENKVFHFVLKQ